MSDEKVDPNVETFLVSENVVNLSADNFGYVSSYSNAGKRYGSITCFQIVTKWESSVSTKQETYITANIRMPEEQMVELAHHIINQYEEAKKKSEQN